MAYADAQMIADAPCAEARGRSLRTMIAAAVLGVTAGLVILGAAATPSAAPDLRSELSAITFTDIG